jgi:hypothetical protein
VVPLLSLSQKNTAPNISQIRKKAYLSEKIRIMILKIGQLVPLQIPSGWTVRLNNWFYQPPLTANGKANTAFISDGTILLLTRYGTEYLTHSHWSRDFYLDLHWHGDLETGYYLLRFYEDDDDEQVLAEFAARAADEVQAQINTWLDGWSIEEFPPIYR